MGFGFPPKNSGTNILDPEKVIPGIVQAHIKKLLSEEAAEEPIIIQVPMVVALRLLDKADPVTANVEPIGTKVKQYLRDNDIEPRWLRVEKSEKNDYVNVTLQADADKLHQLSRELWTEHAGGHMLP